VLLAGSLCFGFGKGIKDIEEQRFLPSPICSKFSLSLRNTCDYLISTLVIWYHTLSSSLVAGIIGAGRTKPPGTSLCLAWLKTIPLISLEGEKLQLPISNAFVDCQSAKVRMVASFFFIFLIRVEVWCSFEIIDMKYIRILN